MKERAKGHAVPIRTRHKDRDLVLVVSAAATCLASHLRYLSAGLEEVVLEQSQAVGVIVVHVARTSMSENRAVLMETGGRIGTLMLVVL